MVTERTIINALIIAASFILVPFIISESLTVDYLPALCLIGLAGVVVAFFFIKENLAFFPVLGLFFAGALNFLPLPLTATNISCIFIILYYITGYVVIKQRPIKVGKPMLFWPIAIVTLIVLHHNHSLSLGALGGSSEGAKPAILIYLVVLAYFCGINLPTPSVEKLSNIPLYAVVVTLFSSAPYLVTTIVPSLAPYLYVITDSVNKESYFESISTSGDSGGSTLSKLAAFGPIGSAVQVYLLAHYPIGSWLRPERWWIVGLSLICALLVASSGYRSDVFGYAFTILAGAWCYYSWRSVFLPALAIVAVMTLVIASSNDLINLPLRKLPQITQRTLSFLPGDWDPEAIESGEGSNKFRNNIRDTYIKEYMGRSPLFGNGFTINTAEFTYWNEMQEAGRGDVEYDQAKVFIEGKMYHTGWISLYDCVGIIGSLGFIALGINSLRLNERFLFGPKSDRRSTLYPLYVWLLCNNANGLACYFVVFGAFNSEFSQMLVFAIVLSHLADLANKSEIPMTPGEIKGHVEMPRISGAYYGRR